MRVWLDWKQAALILHLAQHRTCHLGCLGAGDPVHPNHEQDFRLMRGEDGYGEAVARGVVTVGARSCPGFHERIGIWQSAIDLGTGSLLRGFFHPREDRLNSWLTTAAHPL